MQRRPLIWVAALALAAVLGLSAQASASTVKGTVVFSSKSAHRLVVAGRGGHLSVISSRRVVRPGSVVAVSARKLKSGSLKARHLKVRTHHRHARVRGIVTWASKRSFTVANGRASLLVHRSNSSDDEPLGTPVQTDVTIDDQGDLDEDDTHQVGQVPNRIKIEGVVLSTDTTAGTITISGDEDQECGEAHQSDHGGSDEGDDDNDNEQAPSIVVHVPDASQFTVGEDVELIVTGPAADGSFTLVKVDEQENEQGDDDNNQGQNNQGDDGDQHGGDNSGDDGGGDD